ncbi:unnamed protein product [Acanthoscelides obtectus]|nr:unnamed protein product [Acanthoscelides obtectus]CAK1645684.1 Dynein heavy chain 1, axonemal [Acanthoscelides obtectus]
MNVTAKDLMPVDILSAHPEEAGPTNLSRWTSFLPLELFDDEDYDVRTPENWLQHGVIEGVRYPLPGEAYLEIADEHRGEFCHLFDTYGWMNVAVTDYNFETKKWAVLTLDGLQRTFEVPRLYVMFKAEDPRNFAKRVEAAIKSRYDTENLIRFEFFFDCMPLEGTPPMNDFLMNRITELISNSLGKKWIFGEHFQKLKEEVELNHKRAIAEMEFRNVFEKSTEYKYFNVPQREKPREHKKVETGISNFQQVQKYYGWYNIYVIPETYLAMSYVVGECLKMSQVSLFTANYGTKYVTLEEFEALQIQTTSIVMKQMKGSWLETLVFNIRMCLGDLGKGWFDMNEKNFETYEISKLKRFMDLVKFRMQHTLRLLVENSLQTFITLVETPCIPCLEVEDDFEWGRDFVNSPFVSKASPIFILQLKMNEEGAYYSTQPELFKKVILRLFDEALRQTHQIKQVHPLLLPNLRFPKDLNLSSVGLLAEEVVSIRDRFMRAYDRALVPLLAYANEYKVHTELYTMDVAQFIEQYKSEQHTAVEVKEEVSLHLRHKANLEATLPTNIFIGPYNINVEQLRQFLIAKRQEIATRLLDMFAARMKEIFEDILEEYRKIMVKLAEKPEHIERILEIRDWIETVPMSVRSLDESVKRYLLEYDVLDHFWYALPNEDFDNKYQAVGWPMKISQQVEAADIFLKEEEERFYKLQLQDEFTLHDKIETLTAQVVQMAQLRDFTKTHEIALDMRRVWKSMKEAQEMGQLLNQRQKLFNVPVVPFDDLGKLIKEFEPYKNLWGTASDWLRAYEIWMDNPIQNIDADSIEMSVTDMYKMMVRLIKIFADIEAVQSVASEIRNQIDQFKPLIPILMSLKNPGMKQRHWDKFAEDTGIALEWTPVTTFHDCLKLGIEEYADNMIKIAESATKEYSIEQTLNKMMEEWENNKMELTPYKNTGTYIMKVSDEIQQMLDDHIVLTQQLSFSPFKGPFEEKIDDWEDKLKITAEVIEEWMDVQKQWMYLEPIFTSADITRQLPAESKKYNSMERTWKRIMRNAHECPNLLLQLMLKNSQLLFL